MMKYFITLLLAVLVPFSVQADQRIDSDWCHYVDPPPNANADNETKLPTGQCYASIHESDDNDTATGVSHYKMEYTERTTPIQESVTFTGNGGDINCNLVDGNNTYTTTDWSATYTVKRKRGHDRDDEHRGKGGPRVPQPTDPVTVEFNLECYDAPKQ